MPFQFTKGFLGTLYFQMSGEACVSFWVLQKAAAPRRVTWISRLEVKRSRSRYFYLSRELTVCRVLLGQGGVIVDGVICGLQRNEGQ